MVTYAQHQFTPSTITFVLEGVQTGIDKIIADLKDPPFNSYHAELVVDKRGCVSQIDEIDTSDDIYFWHMSSPDVLFSAFGVRWRVLIVNFRNKQDLAVLFKMKYCTEQEALQTWHMSLLSSHSAIFDHALGIPLNLDINAI
jgi:hypothetical protein